MAEETTFRRLRHALLELLRGYPSYRFFGKIESYLKESQSSLLVLKKDGIIEFASKKESQALNKKLTEAQWTQLRAEGKKEPIWYRLTPKGVDLAMSMINLEYSDKVLRYAHETNIYNNRLRWVTAILAVFACASVLIGLAQLLF